MDVLAALTALERPDSFVSRHVAPGEAEQSAMLQALGLGSLLACISLWLVALL